MKKILNSFFVLFFAISMAACSDDSINIIDVGNGDDNGDDEVSTIYSATFNVDGGGTFTFSVDMDGATIEGDDLPDDFDGEVYTFDPENDRVFVTGAMLGWSQPGTGDSARLTRAGNNTGFTIDAGSTQFKFFIVPPGVMNDDDVNATWAYGEWEGDPNRSTDIAGGDDFFDVWGNKPEDTGDDNGDSALEALYMIGDGVGTWDWDETNLPMYQVAGDNGHLFWKIVWMNEEGGFKFAPQREWSGDFGYDGNDPEDEIYQRGGTDVPVPGVEGYYMVVYNDQTQEIAVTTPLVYLIGETVDSWDTANEEALFTVDNDNEVITITRDLLAAELRMYAWFDKGWFTDWWQSEFMIFDGEIEFRGSGGDQERVNLDADGEYTIELNFKTGEGSIEAN